jgi:zinc and cadmium transporter
MSWIWPAFAGFVASTAALIGSGAILILGNKAERAADWLLSFAIGTLLGAATLGLLPEALDHGSQHEVFERLLAGMLGFTLFERILHWRHPHHVGAAHHPKVERATASMILWGDALHNLTDGLIIGVSFNISFELGMSTSLAVLAHEIPQEIGDFSILLASGMAKRRALLLNYLAALTPIPGALLSYHWAGAAEPVSAWLLPISAGGFLYIALANLVPALHHRRGLLAGVLQVVLMVAGVAVIALMHGGHH